MKKYMLVAVILPMLSLFAITTSYADNTLSFYTGLKLGYNYLMMDEATLTAADTDKYKSAGSPTASIGFVTGITLPITTTLAIRPAFEYTFIAPNSISATAKKASHSGLNELVVKANANALFANLYIDFYVAHNIYLYAGGGVGVSILSTKTEALFRTKYATTTNFAWNAGLGAGYYITENISLDLGVRYIDLGSSKAITTVTVVDISPLSKIDFSTIEALFTVAYKF